MIQIIAGTFGYYNGRKVIPITEADGPQQFDPELEERLVKQGVAKYIGAAPAASQDLEPTDTGAEDPEDEGDELPEYSAEMKLDELKEIAAAYGVDASAMRKKSDIIEAIEAAKQEIDDGEEPPLPGVADPV